jgi:Zn finger protein HypA/HybF involved in hydrogenase expression
MSLHEKITQLIDEELEDRVNAIINEYALSISKKHAIPLELLLKDIPTSYTSTICKGTKANGQRCVFKCVENGYCRHHLTQCQKITQRSISNSSLHNHGPEKMFDPECPGCQSSNGLIDLGI